MTAKYKENDWKVAKKRCQLNQNDIQMAKELGMTPKSLMKNIPSKNQQWKLPVKDWIRELYEEKFGTVVSSAETSRLRSTDRNTSQKEIEDEDLPF